GFCQVASMAGAARGLHESPRQERLLPGEGRFMPFSNLRGRALAAVTYRAAPVPDVMRDRRMGPEWLRNIRIHQTRLRHALVAGDTAVYHAHFGYPDLINAGMKIRQQTFGVRPRLRKARVGALILLPFQAEVFRGRDRQDG